MNLAAERLCANLVPANSVLLEPLNCSPLQKVADRQMVALRILARGTVIGPVLVHAHLGEAHVFILQRGSAQNGLAPTNPFQHHLEGLPGPCYAAGCFMVQKTITVESFLGNVVTVENCGLQNSCSPSDVRAMSFAHFTEQMRFVESKIQHLRHQRDVVEAQSQQRVCPRKLTTPKGWSYR